MRKNAAAVVLGALLAGLSAGWARAEAAKDEGGKPEREERADRDERGGGRGKGGKRLGLTEEQREKLKEQRKAHREKAKELREAQGESRKALREELQKPELDEKAVRKAHARLKEADAKLADHRLEGVLALRRILTPEQFRKMMERKRGGRGRFGGWFGGRKDGARDEHQD